MTTEHELDVISREQKILTILQTNFCSRNDFDLELLRLKSLQPVINKLPDMGDCPVISKIIPYRIMVAERIRFLSNVSFSDELKKETAVLPNFNVEEIYQQAIAMTV